MIKKRFKSVMITTSVLILWYVIAIINQNVLLPDPLKVLNKIYNNFSDVKYHLLYSVMRLTGALLITFIIGIVMGVVLGLYPKLNKTLSPIVYMTYPVPKMALLPFVMIVFGFGEATKVIMIIMITLFPVIINVRDEVMNIDSGVFDVMVSLGSSKLEIIKNIVLPSVLPTILTTLRISVGIALSVLFFVENYGTQYGLGYSIMDYWMRADYPGVYASIILISLLGIIMYKIIDYAELKICAWKRNGGI
ncbi:MAG: ABC transporter permease [Acidaminobacteraceae bacterium]